MLLVELVVVQERAAQEPVDPLIELVGQVEQAQLMLAVAVVLLPLN